MALLRHLEDLGRGEVEEGLGVAALAVAAGDNLVGHLDHAPHAGHVGHDAGVRLDVGDGGDGVGELAEVLGAADGVEPLAGPELRGQGDHVDGLAPGRQGLDALEDHPVGGVVEVPRGAHALGHAEGRVVEEDGPEHGPFGVEVVGGHPTVHRGRCRQGGRRVDEGLLGVTIPKISLRASHTSLNAWHGSDVGGKFCTRFPRRLDPRGSLRQGGAGQASWAPFGITTMPVSDT